MVASSGEKGEVERLLLYRWDYIEEIDIILNLVNLAFIWGSVLSATEVNKVIVW